MENTLHPQLTLLQINALPALSLAYIGDAVFELMVRTALCAAIPGKHGALHKKAVSCVRAEAQAALTGRLLPLLTEEETGFYRRGRNAHVNSIPKNATASEYSKATGVEALFGALYLLGRQARAEELYAAVTEEHHAV